MLMVCVNCFSRGCFSYAAFTKLQLRIFLFHYCAITVFFNEKFYILTILIKFLLMFKYFLIAIYENSKASLNKQICRN